MEKKRKRGPSSIGRRTGVDILKGKKIRKQDDGTDVFSDNWSDPSNIKTESEKSPGAAESRRKETPDLLDHLGKNNIASSESSTPQGIRRSTRFKVKPLDFWRFQSLKFEKSPSGSGFRCVGVDEGLPEDNSAIKMIERRMARSKISASKNKKGTNIKSL